MSERQVPVDFGRPDQSLAGYWRFVARPRGKEPVDISAVRGIETSIGRMVTADPFGPKEMTLVLPMVSIFDRLGEGDLWWCRRHVDIDVIWEGDLPAGFTPVISIPGSSEPPKWRWEGYIANFSRGDGLTIQIKGANYQLDNWLAKPEYPQRPLPYEWAIARQFLNKPSLRLEPLRIIWPDWWSRVYTPVAKAPSYMIPAGVTAGDKWTDLVTRSTGNWDPVLTSYIQGLLTAMYDSRGRWTIDLDAHRQPVMFHRANQTVVDDTVVVIDLADPGVKPDLNEDWEQSLTTVFGQGTSLSGVAFSGMNVSADGTSTTYNPLAYLRQAYPESDDNPWRDLDLMVKEVFLQMQAGLSADDAAQVARAHLARFAEPGQVGTIRLKSDPKMGGITIPRGLLRAGLTVHLPRAMGYPGGVLAHVTQVETDTAKAETVLTLDSKFRDALTSEEVRLRGRDALSVTRMLVAGQYQPPVSDQMLPWSYEQGSGVIPSNPVHNATRLFSGMPSTVQFPWTDWTTARPPKDSKWKSSYLSLGAAQANADANWITQSSASGVSYGVPIQMAQAGTIRLLQVAAYDVDGNVLPVPFHISFYYVGGVNVMSMPRIPADQKAMFPPYATGQHYPFVRDGFEAFKIDGTKNDPNVPQPTESVGLIRAYGTFYEKAGFWPGSYADGDQPTGLLVDEQQWSFDTTNTADAYWDPYRAERNLTNPKAGKVYAMIYCDGQLDQEVFFLGRMFRVEPGTGGA